MSLQERARRRAGRNYAEAEVQYGVNVADVSHNSLGRDAAKFGQRVPEEPRERVTSLGLRGQRFTGGGRYLVYCLKTRVQLTARRRESLGVAAGVAFAGAIKELGARHLNLEKNGLGTKGGKSIAWPQDNYASCRWTCRTMVRRDAASLLRGFAQAGHADVPGPVGPDRQQFNYHMKCRVDERRHARVDGRGNKVLAAWI